MKNIYIVLLLILTLGLTSCDNEPKNITASEDYNLYFGNENKSLAYAQKEYSFWEEKLEKNPSQFPYLSKMAAANSLKFKSSGNVDYLTKAEDQLLHLNKKTNYNNASYLRSLARNNISQHKFKKALEFLLLAEENGQNLVGTQAMLFDVYLELGNNEKAKHYLKEITNFKDFNYLIRLSKYSDHQGDLDAAINYLERAMNISENTKNKKLMQWLYTNLADYYGHAGRINDSYQFYLKALQIDPNDAYAKKGISWIVYSYERNPQEALRILNEIEYKTPDYYLLKAEIAEFMGNLEEKNNNIKTYEKAVKNSNYGVMYNRYNSLLYAEDLNNYKKALKIAKTEIEERPTVQSYDLLAWIYYLKGDYKKALQIIDEHVINKSFEPKVLYHVAQIYKANNEKEKVKSLKKELKESIYELGPLLEQKIKML